MQITIKTLKNSVFKIESELDVDVADFKKKVEEHDKECPHAQQKLIYQVISVPSLIKTYRTCSLQVIQTLSCYLIGRKRYVTISLDRMGEKPH